MSGTNPKWFLNCMHMSRFQYEYKLCLSDFLLLINILGARGSDAGATRREAQREK